MQLFYGALEDRVKRLKFAARTRIRLFLKHVWGAEES